MSRISVDVSSARIPVLQVGYQGENEVTDVLFDISSWITEFGEGVAQLRVKRPGNSEEESYVLSLTITDGISVWTVSETDTFNKGNGKVQLSYLVGNIVKKAVIYPYKVGKSIVGADNPVDPFDSWIERSKAWAIGKTLDGNDVPETDETYQNNAKYYAEQADILGSAQVVLATEQGTLATEKATLATEKADAASQSEANAAASEAAVNGVSTQLTTRMSAIETEQSVQSARMDTFTSLPEGSTSGNAELADIRVGADGTTYDTAGNAVRGQIGELKSDLVNVLGDKVFINPSIEVDTIYSNSYHNGLNMSGYNTYTFSLEQGKTYHINTKVIDANGYAVCYKFKDNVWVNLEGEYPTYSGVVSDYEFVCGNDCNAIKITTYQYIPNVYCNGVTTMNIPDAISLIESSVFKNYVKFEQNECYVKAKYDDTHDIVFRINIGGGNLLPDIRYVYLVDNNGALNDDLNYSRYIISNPSDIISPHIICANENGDGDHPTMEYFTGGNHRSDNTGTGGGVTAHNVSFNVYCDDKSVSNSAFGNKITVKWVNTIAGYNTSKDDGTGREILKEEVTFEIVGPRINVNIKHTALESLSRVEYFGLQMMCDDMENIVYVGGSNRGSYDPKTASNSGDKNCRVVLISNNTNKDMIEIGIENIDLGSFANDSLAYSAFTTVAKKSYFGIIYDGLPITMAEGDITTLRGYYEFKPILN